MERPFAVRLEFVGAFLLAWAVLLWSAPELEFYLDSSDHGLQLALGQQVLLGRIPGVDVLIAGGPLQGYASAVGLLFGRGLLGETLLCAAGYAASLALIYRLVARHTSRATGLLAACCGLLLLARFYKWYVWFFPMAVLWALDGYANAPPEKRYRWSAAAGLLLGVGWLFRFDLATTGTVAAAVFLAIVEFGQPGTRPRRIAAAWLPLAAAAAAPVAAWFLGIAVARGPSAAADFVRMTIDGTFGVVQGMALPLPPWSWSAPLAPYSAIVLGFWLTLATLLAACAYGLWREFREPDPLSRMLLATGLIGLSVFHQASHRRDVAHLLQAIAPVIVAAHLLVGLFLDRCWGRPCDGPRRRLVRGVGLAYLVTAAAVVAALVPFGRQDLAPLHVWPRARYARLARPLERGGDAPALQIAREVQSHTAPDEPILVFPIGCQHYVFAGRPMSGMITGYYPDIWMQQRWQHRNRQSLAERPPALVIAPRGLTEPDGLAAQARRSHADVDAWLRERYPRVLAEAGDIVLLGPADGVGGPR